MSDIFDDEQDSDIEDEFVFDPEVEAAKAVAADLNPSVLDGLDESNVPRAKNWFEFAYGKEFLDIPTVFPRQVEVSTNFLAQFCPRCTNPKFLDEREDRIYLSYEVDSPLHDIIDHTVFLNDGVCPKCSITRPELFDSGELKHHIELIGCAGQRSSKTVVTGMMACYQLHKYLTVPNPSKALGLLKTELSFLFVALTAEQAGDTLWINFDNLVSNSPWFTEYHKFLNDVGKKVKRPLHAWGKTQFKYFHKSLAGGFSGSEARTKRGRTRIFTASDECGWWDVEADKSKKRANAYEMHASLANSLATVRGKAQNLMKRGVADPLDAYEFNISSPSAINDPIMTWLKEADEDDTKFAFHMATWEFNPDLPYSVVKTMAKNQLILERDFGAQPGLGTSVFIDAEDSIEKLCRPAPQSLANWQIKTTKDFSGDESVYADVKPFPDKSRPRVLCVDTGLTNNSFAIALLSYDRDRGVIDVDFALEVEPKEDYNGKVLVNFPEMYEKCIVPLVRNCNVIKVLYDRWNTIESIQRLRNDEHIDASAYSLKYQDFLAIRSKIMDKGVSFPQAEMTIADVRSSRKKLNDTLSGNPIISLIMQTLMVREVGRKITKPLDGNDDIFRAMCLGIHHIIQPENLVIFENYSQIKSTGKKSRGGIGVYRSQRGGGNVSSTASGSRVGIRKKRGL